MKNRMLFTLLALSISLPALANESYTITIKNHRFSPDTVTIPAGKKIKLIIKNEDSSPEEFESHDLNREKIIMGGAQASVFVGPLKPGKYNFFGEFNPKTAQGHVVAK